MFKRLLLLTVLLLTVNGVAQSDEELDSLWSIYGTSQNWNGSRWDSLDIVRIGENEFAIRHDSTVAGYYFGFRNATTCGNNVDKINVYTQELTLNPVSQSLPNYRFVLLKDGSTPEGYIVKAVTAHPTTVIDSHTEHFNKGEWVKIMIPCPDVGVGYGNKNDKAILIGGKTLSNILLPAIEDDVTDSLVFMPVPNPLVPDPIIGLTVPKALQVGYEDSSSLVITGITGTIDDLSDLVLTVTGGAGISSVIITEVSYGNWSLGVVPTKDYFGKTSIDLIMTDTLGRKETASIPVEFLAVNDKPAVVLTNTINIVEGQGDTLNIMDYLKQYTLGPSNESIQKVKQFAILSYDTSRLESISIENDSTLIIQTSTVSQTITDSIRLMLYDNGGTDYTGTDSTEFILVYTIQYTKRGPVLSVPDSSVIGYEDAVLVIDEIQGSDHDGGVLTLSVSSTHNVIKAIQVFENKDGIWGMSITPKEDVYGKDSVTLVLTDDSGLSDTAQIAVEYLSVNDQPKILRKSELSFWTGKSFSINLEDYIAYTLGPENESDQRLQDIEIQKIVGGVFEGEVTIADGVLTGVIPEGTLSSTGAFQFKLVDDGGVQNNGVNASENFIQYFTVNNANQTEIEIDSIDLVDTVMTEGPFKTVFTNGETAIIHISYGDKDSAVVVENIENDTLVTIIAHHPHDQFPDTASVLVKYNATPPIISLLPEGRSEAQAPFGQGSYWVSDGKEIKGTYVEKKGSVETVWTHDETLELHMVVTKIDLDGEEVVTHSQYSLDSEGSLNRGEQERCVQETDLYRNTTQFCFTVRFDTEDPEIEFITPSETVKKSSSSLLVTYNGIFDLYNDDKLDTFRIEEPDVRVFDGSGNHQISVSYTDAYGNTTTATTAVTVVIPDPAINISLEKNIQVVDPEAWPLANPEEHFNRIYIYNTNEQSFDDRGGDMANRDQYGILPEPNSDRVEYDATGFVVSLTVTLPPLVAVNGVLNWSHYVTVFYYVYDPIGQFVAKIAQRIVIDKPEYINEEDKVIIKSQIFPQKGYMENQTGRELGSGVYIMNGYVETVSEPNKDMFKNIKAQSTKMPIRLKQGYVKD
ncbi:MAG: cadherin-like domain-containing protein [Fibrobacterales bacterium]